MRMLEFNFLVGWLSMLCGVISGSLIGLRFHEANWLGGYGSFPRRLVRLGHIAFMGMGILNLLAWISLRTMPEPGAAATVAVLSFALAALTMPATCFLTARWQGARMWFPVPVLCTACGILALLIARY